MYCKIENDIIVSYSKTKMEWWLYTESEWLYWWMLVITCVNTETQNNLDEDIHTITCEDPNKENKEITEKVTRMRVIRQLIRSYWWSTGDLDFEPLDTIDNAEIAELQNEYLTLKGEVETYNATLVVDIINSLFW